MAKRHSLTAAAWKRSCLWVQRLLLVIETVYSACFRFAQADPLSVSNGVILRCVLAALCILIAVAGLMFEFVISANRNVAEKPLVVEEKRINY